VVLAGAVVLIPNAPLLAISIAVNIIAALLMAPALIFALLLANDKRLTGNLSNSRAANAASGSIVALISGLGLVYAAQLVIPLFRH
jgi:Mn2+/Fe2+ NRAMP family transporter